MKEKMKKVGILFSTLMLVSVVTAGTLFAAGQQDDGESDQYLIYNAVSETNGYDPMKCSGLDQRTLIATCFEGLLRVAESGEYVPGQAKSWDVKDDGLKYVFYLRDDIVWSDGKPVTAGDFAYAWRKQLEPEFASPSANNIYIIKNAEAIHQGNMKPESLGVTVVDDRTLEVELETANPFVLEVFAHASTFPVREDIVEKNPDGWTLSPETYIGNGPFKMVTWKSQEVIELEKNPTYYNAEEVKLDSLTFVFIQESTTALAALRTNEIDVTESVPAVEIPNLITEGMAVVTPMCATYYYSVNMNPDMVPNPEKMEAIWNKDVRHALNLAIDRTAITENLLKGGQIPAYGFAPEGVIGVDGKDFRKEKEYFDPQGDVEKAQELLAKAGYPGGKGFPKYEIFYNTSEMHATVAQAVQDMWKKNLGIEVSLVNKETKVFAEDRALGKHEIVRGGNLCSTSYPEILGLFVPENMESLNDPKWINEEYVQLVKEAARGTDPEEIFELYHQAEDILMEEMVVMPIFYYTRVLAKNAEVEGLYKKGQLYFDRAYRK